MSRIAGRQIGKFTLR